MGFLDEVIERRATFTVLEGRVAGQVALQLRALTRLAVEKVEGLRAFTDAKGKLQDLPSARRAAEAAVVELHGASRAILGKATEKLTAGMRRSYRDSVREIAAITEAATGQEVGVGASFQQIFTKAVEKAADRPVLGVRPDRSLDRTAAYAINQLQGVFAGAFLTGETLPKTTAKVKAVLQITETAAVRITRTNLTAAANDAHKDIYDAEPDIFDGYTWEATLDARTSTACAHLHGTFFPIGSKPPGPPQHPNCRCVLVGHFKDDELQALVAADTRRVRKTSAKKGPFQDHDRDPVTGRRLPTELVPGDEPFDRWLRRQPPEVSATLLGSKLKDSLWRGKRLGWDELLGPDLNYRTDFDLVRRAYAKSHDDPWVADLAKQYGAPKVQWETILREDQAAMNDAPFRIGVRPDMDAALKLQITKANGTRKTDLERKREQQRARLAKAREAAKEKRDKEKKKTPNPEKRKDPGGDAAGRPRTPPAKTATLAPGAAKHEGAKVTPETTRKADPAAAKARLAAAQAKIAASKAASAAAQVAANDVRTRIVVEGLDKVSPAFRAEIEKTLAGMPTDLLERLEADGYKVKTGKRLTDILPNLKGVRPRGWTPGLTWENAEGVYNTAGSAAVVSEERKDYYSRAFIKARPPQYVLTHELGHAIDAHLGNISHSDPSYVSDYIDEKAELTTKGSLQDQAVLSYYTQLGYAGREELFAQGTLHTFHPDALDASQRAALEKHFPKSLAHIRRMIATPKGKTP